MTARARIDDLIARIDELDADTPPLTREQIDADINECISAHLDREESAARLIPEPVTPGVLALLGEGAAYLARLIWRRP